ncbi:MAG: VOC family protein [Pseudomonadota bacterium]
MSKFVKALVLMIGTTFCAAVQADTHPQATGGNPVIWFEIPATDLERAMRFYETVFVVDLRIVDVGPSRLALFPSEDGKAGAAGALAQCAGFEPAAGGALVFFEVSSIQETIVRATEAGGVILMPQTDLPGLGLTANVGDTEGNQIALFELY